MKGTMYATLLLLLVGVSVRASEQPDCAKECVDLPGVTQEVRRTITDEGETCTLDPKYQDCVLERCQTSTIPQGLKDYLKENYECDLSSASSRLASLLATVLAFILALLLK